MKNLVITLFVASALLIAVGARADGQNQNQNFGNYSYKGRFACQATSQGYYNHSSSASWIVEPKGNGYYYQGELCGNPLGSYGPCECFFYLNTEESSYSVDQLGLVTEDLTWDLSYGSEEYCPYVFYDHVGGALFSQGSYQPLGTNISDDSTAGSDEPGDGFCSK
jgi:hypothetical protein